MWGGYNFVYYSRDGDLKREGVMGKKLNVVYFVVLALFLTLNKPAWATTFTVNTFDDPAPVAAPNGCSNGGRCSLREAILSSNRLSDTDTIMLQEGTYQLALGQLLVTGPSGNTGSLTIQGAGVDKTFIKADPTPDNRVLEIDSATSSLINIQISDLTIQDGHTTDRGGGILLNDNVVNLTLTHCNFVNNQAAGEGGAVWYSTADGILHVDGGLYSNNKTTAGRGGALSVSGGAGGSKQFLFENAVFTNNEATVSSPGPAGGAIFLSPATCATFSNLQVIGNKAHGGQGGGIFMSCGGNLIKLENSIIQNNTSDDKGAGVYFSLGGVVQILNSTIEGNQILTSGDGGGAYINNGGGLLIKGNTFSGNLADNGGGLFHIGASGASFEITNSTFSSNEARITGGGMSINPTSTPTLSLNNLSVVKNKSGSVGAGIDNNSSNAVVLRNSLFVGNDSGGSSDDCIGIIDSTGYNIFGSPNDGDCEPDAMEVGQAPNDLVADPKVGPLAPNGGANQTHALLAGSPAIDGGNPAGCQDGSGTNLNVDERGQTRPLGARCDVGAVEMGSTDLQLTKTADASSVVVGGDIVYTLTVKNNGPDAALNVTVTDTLPANVTFVSADPQCSENSGTVTCNLGPLASGASASASLTVMTTAEGPVTNSATAGGTELDPSPANAASSATTTVTANGGGGGGQGSSSGGGCGLEPVGFGLGRVAWTGFLFLFAGTLGLRLRARSRR
jgi:uncharacterized repeat protein (TIGR01451 family)/CSLREA domain-containing protein